MNRSPELTEALSNLVNTQPFFSAYLYGEMDIKETDEVPTAATNGVSLFVNPKFFKSLTIPQRVFVLAHEVMHGILLHMQRGKAYSDRGIGPDFKPWNHNKANQAMDYIINDALKTAKVGSAPPDLLHDTNIATEDDIFDEVYPRLPDPPDNGNGSGNGNGHGGFDDHLPPDPNQVQPTESEVKRAVAGARQAAKAMGNMPANLDRMMGEIIEPKMDWKDILRDSLVVSLGYDEASWNKPSRRRLALAPHVYLPGSVGHSTGNLAIVIDTSGSISQKELSAFMSEVQGILDDAKPAEVFVYWTDAKVAGIDELDDMTDLTELKPKGGGGTHMPAAYPEIEKVQDTQDLTCLFLTDGYTGWGDEPDYKVIVVTTSKTGCEYALPEIKMEI